MAIKPTDAWTRDEKAKARAILLEPSPWPVDGGELIGRDPRKIPAEDVRPGRTGGEPSPAGDQGQMLGLLCPQEAEVRKCVLIPCPNWPYRLGFRFA